MIIKEIFLTNVVNVYYINFLTSLKDVNAYFINLMTVNLMNFADFNDFTET